MDLSISDILNIFTSGEVTKENLEEHRSQLPSGLNHDEVHEYLNECYLWNRWDDFTKENIRHDFKIMYPGDYEIVGLEILGEGGMFSKFQVHIKYPTEAEQVWHVLRWS